MSSVPTELWCLVDEDSAKPFTIALPGNINTLGVKTLIKREKPKAFDTVDASDLTLWKLNVNEPVDPDRSLLDRIRKLGDELSMFATEMSSGEKVSLHFAKPLMDHLHILVEVPQTDAPPQKRLRTSKSLPLSKFCLRSDTVEAIYQKLNLYKFVQVRGTPASGKTSVAELIRNHVREQESDTHVIWIQGWPFEPGKGSSRWEGYFENELGWDKLQETVFIFDEAQSTYWDGDLWHNFIKPIDTYEGRRAILFASYGSPTSRVAIAGTPIFIQEAQRVTLRPIQHNDDTTSAGLFFTRPEFDDLVANLYPSPQYSLDSSFLDAVFDLTEGHVGAFLDFIKIIIAHESYSTISKASQFYTWNSFESKVSPRTLVERLENSATRFARGLPSHLELQDLSNAHVFTTVLRNGVITDRDCTTKDEKEALMTCFHSGWLQSDKLNEIGRPEEAGYCFSSELHRWYVEWKLSDTIPAKPFDTTNILEFVLNTIRAFSPRAFSTKRVGPGFIQRIPKAQYQDEFYHCCHKISNGSLVSFPEFGTKKGRVDFYIPTKQWGVELLREGDRLAQHSGRFSQTGSYGSTMVVSDYIILDCRTTYPKTRHSYLPKLYHVVFTSDFTQVEILDNRLKLVPSGKFGLLGST